MAKPQDFILTKIIATLGPASATAAAIRRFIEEGARVFRLNLSHGTDTEHLALLGKARAAAEALSTSIAVFGDLPGPKIRVGAVAGEGVEVQAGERVTFQTQPLIGCRQGNEVVLSCTYPRLTSDVQPGQRVLINDGAVRMLAVERTGDGDEARLICTVTVGGKISTAKGINLPETDLKLPSLTERDWRGVEWALKHDLDYLALSFVRRAEDVRQLREGLHERLKARGIAPPPIIAKIEKPQALAELEAIIAEADAVMVARGDLGVEMDLAQVPVIQKRIIRMAHEGGKPAIVATQMLQSMIESPSPTRAEVSDVSNAIYDGADAVMLSGETAVGHYPTQAVAMMARVARLTEEHLREQPACQSMAQPQPSRYRTAAIAHGVNAMVVDLQPKLVVCWTETGGSARYLSQARLPMPIVAATACPRALRRMNLLFGVVPVAMPRPATAQEFIERMDDLIRQRGWAADGDAIVATFGHPLGQAGLTNTVHVHYIGDRFLEPKAAAPQ